MSLDLLGIVGAASKHTREPKMKQKGVIKRAIKQLCSVQSSTELLLPAV